MNPLTDMLFSIIWIVLFAIAVRQMSRGWSIAAEQRERARNYTNMNVRNRTVTKVQHPEMADVKPGDELLVVDFKAKDVDPLHESLQNRISQGQVDDPWYEDDDEGGLVVRK
tara:strand:- start:47 stop:382 length:336 start_codon:yes stop_codon:yes gene_type:complete